MLASDKDIKSNNTILNNHHNLFLVSIIQMMNYRHISDIAFTLVLRGNILESHLDSAAYDLFDLE